MGTKFNTVGWFEIPATNMERAITFYERVFDLNITLQDFGGVKMGWFPSQGNVYGATGCLIKNYNYEPRDNGTLVYFSCDDLQNQLNAIPIAGGKITKEKTEISPTHGNMAVFIDSEGNRIALHSKK